MTDIKFQCPSCNQKIQVDAAAGGRQINCPGCQAKIQIPIAQIKSAAPPSAAKAAATETAPTAASSPKPKAPPASAPEAALPSKPGSPSAPTPQDTTNASPQSGNAAAVPTSSMPANPPPKPGTVLIPKAREAAPKPAASSVPEQPEAAPSVKVSPSRPQNQVARLTPALKREIIRSVRRRLADEAHWMPRITPEREYAYAAKVVDGKPVRVQPTDPEATRFSVLGALLLEFHERNVTQTASGRQELLGQELLEALRTVVGDEAGEQEVAPGELPSSGKGVPPVSHAQCLEALDVLEAQYTGGMEESAAAVRTTADDLRLPDLMEKLERQRPVTMEEMGTALSNELKTIHERLDELEGSRSKG